MIELQIKTTAQHFENISDQLLLLGAHAVTWQDAGEQPVYEPLPDEIIPWQAVNIRALFSEEIRISTIIDYLHSQQIHASDCQLLNVPDHDWVRVCLDQFQAMSFGKRLWIVPSWFTPPQESAVNIRIDPGLAFGTGTHPTTALCLNWLDVNIKDQTTLIDYGCGSGILAISAAKLGVAQVIAIDHDEQARLACAQNAKLNETHIDILGIDHAPLPKADIVLANILAKTILEHKKIFRELLKENGILILSGILKDQCTEILNAYQADFQVLDIAENAEWARIDLQFIPSAI